MEILLQLLQDTLKVFLTVLATGCANKLVQKLSTKRSKKSRRPALQRRGKQMPDKSKRKKK
ncbi:hypothetical protein AB1J99_31415 [Bacillus bombysepticus]|uniref:Uncharacterized protein n=1 Tax=Bacillus cereus TaxID=1396 RepID=A0A9X7GUB2_BACCE|nr:hypothetical protein [Bacillus cereus]PGS74568.1 hypothetical protein COC69_22955 [Bacillus cereus]